MPTYVGSLVPHKDLLGSVGRFVTLVLQIRKLRPGESNSPGITCFSVAVSETQCQASLAGSESGWLDLLLTAWPWANPMTSGVSALLLVL